MNDTARSGWRWAPAWVLAFVALWPAPGYAEAVLALGAIAGIARLLLSRFRGSAALLSGPAWALTSVLFFAYWLPEAISAIDAADRARAWREALVDLLAREGADFYAENVAPGERERRYLRAYALIGLLMRDRAGQAALGGVLAAQAMSPCMPVAAEKVFDAAYPGGLSGLAREWTVFMRNPPRDIRSY